MSGRKGGAVYIGQAKPETTPHIISRGISRVCSNKGTETFEKSCLYCNRQGKLLDEENTHCTDRDILTLQKFSPAHVKVLYKHVCVFCIQYVGNSTVVAGSCVRSQDQVQDCQFYQCTYYLDGGCLGAPHKPLKWISPPPKNRQ